MLVHMTLATKLDGATVFSVKIERARGKIISVTGAMTLRNMYTVPGPVSRKSHCNTRI